MDVARARRICDFSDLSLILLPINLSRLSNTLRPGYCPPFFLRLSSVSSSLFPFLLLALYAMTREETIYSLTF